jgi:hypothetical protein
MNISAINNTLGTLVYTNPSVSISANDTVLISNAILMQFIDNPNVWLDISTDALRISDSITTYTGDAAFELFGILRNKLKFISQDPSLGEEPVIIASEVDEDGKRRMLVDSKLDSGQLVPTITNKLKIRYSVTDISLTTSYTTLFSRSGTGLFFGFQTAYDHSAISIKLIVDGGTVFEITLDDIRQFQFNDTSTTKTQMGAFLTTIGNVLDFSSKFAIPYGTNVTIQARTLSGTRKNKNWIMFLTEDT